MAQATYDDVNLILRLYDMRREPRLRQAREWFSKSFRAKTLQEFETLCPAGSEPNAFARMVITYWEMVASFVTAGVLNEELFFQSGRELLFVWERVRDMLPSYRTGINDPAAWKNLEIVAGSFIAFLKKNNPGAYEAFSKRVRGE